MEFLFNEVSSGSGYFGRSCAKIRLMNHFRKGDTTSIFPFNVSAEDGFRFLPVSFASCRFVLLCSCLLCQARQTGLCYCGCRFCALLLIRPVGAADFALISFQRVSHTEKKKENKKYCKQLQRQRQRPKQH